MIKVTFFPRNKELIEEFVEFVSERANGCEFEDLREEEFPEYIINDLPKPDKIFVAAYFEKFEEAFKIWEEVEKKFGKTEYMIEVVDDNYSLNQAKEPVQVGTILITNEKVEENPELINIVISSTGAFGTGHHPTTRMCLQLLQKYVKDGDKVLDVGAGTGILSIAACKLGAKEVLAVEIEKESIYSLQKNIEDNNCKDKIRILNSDGVTEVKENYDVIVANILFEVLKNLIPDMLKIGNFIIVSGILDKEDEEFKKLFGNKILEELAIGQWKAYCLKGEK